MLNLSLKLKKPYTQLTLLTIPPKFRSWINMVSFMAVTESVSY